MLNDNPAIGPVISFWVYAMCSLLGLIFIFTMLPETKSHSLEEIERSWGKRWEVVESAS